MGDTKVTLIEPGDGIFVNVKRYFEQSFKLGTAQSDIDGNPIATHTQGIGSILAPSHQDMMTAD